ncbi:glycosyltransferase [Candidatus Woesearchaeota archaeon]|nr:glycosyltransferase [Candidatus Woesearchaeota archaeon]MCF8013132.1 glycosyltransferase [Candidatus Woesearchaeota archaeon]
MKFSIITPSYNQDMYIEQTIKSVIEQKGNFEIEYIIMDGKSTDNTVKILKKYEKKLKGNKKIKFIWKSEKDKGQSDAINKGLKICSGDILAYINSDDYYEKDAFRNIIKEFEKNKKISFVYGKCPVVNEEDKEIRKGIRRIRRFLGRKYSYRKLLIVNFIPQPATFWKKEIYDKYGGFDVKHHLCMDYEYWLRIGQEFKGKYVNKNISNFRWYSQSKSGSGYKKQFKEDLNVAKKYGQKYKFSLFLHEITYRGIVFIYDVMRVMRI